MQPRNPFRNLPLVGSGWLGCVYRTAAPESGTPLALKSISLTNFPEATWDRLCEDVRLLSQLDHEHLTRFTSIHIEPAGYLVLERKYYPDTLQTLIERHRALGEQVPEMKVWEILGQIASALAYLHSPFKPLGPVCHFDLKTSNVMFSEEGICLTDYCLCPVMHCDWASSFSSTRIPGFREEFGTSKADIWLLGSVIYELCTLQPLEYDPELPEMPVVALRGYSEQLCTVVRNCLNIHQERRPIAQELVRLSQPHALPRQAQRGPSASLFLARRASSAGRQQTTRSNSAKNSLSFFPLHMLGSQTQSIETTMAGLDPKPGTMTLTSRLQGTMTQRVQSVQPLTGFAPITTPATYAARSGSAGNAHVSTQFKAPSFVNRPNKPTLLAPRAGSSLLASSTRVRPVAPPSQPFVYTTGPSASGSGGYEALKAAIWEGNMDDLTANLPALSAGNCNELLKMAILKERYSILPTLCQYLRAHGLPACAPAREGTPSELTTLMICAAEGDALGVASQMYDVGKIHEGMTALMFAARNDRVECVKLLLTELGIHNEHRDTALIEAAKNGSFSSVDLLMSEATKTDADGMTALMWAAAMGHRDIVAILRRREMMMQQPSGSTALYHAVKNRKIDCVKLLVQERGISNVAGDTAIDIARKELEAAATETQRMECSDIVAILKDFTQNQYN